MTLPTCAVTCSVFDDSGLPMSGATVTATLDRFEVYQGYVVPQSVSITTDPNGYAILHLWPNELGATASSYIIKITGANGKKITTTAVVPNQGTMPLHLIANLPAYDGKVDGQIMLEAAIQAGVDAGAQANRAVTFADQAEAFAYAAELAAAQATGALARLKSPQFTWIDNLLVRIEYDNGAYKQLSYADGVLYRIDLYNGPNLTRKLINRDNGLITSIMEIGF